MTLLFVCFQEQFAPTKGLYQKIFYKYSKNLKDLR